MEKLPTPERPRLEVPRAEYLNNAGNLLVMVGTTHTSDPLHPQLHILEDHFKDWLSRTEGHERKVHLEGRVENSPLPPHRGEFAAIQSWATVHEIPCEGLDPLKDPSETLLKISNRDPLAIFYYFVARRIPQALQPPEGARPNLHAHIEETMRFYKHFLPAGFECTVEVLRDIHAKLFPKVPFDSYDVSFFLEQTTGMVRPENPLLPETSVQKVARNCHDLRRAAFARRNQEALQKGFSCFAAFSSWHFEPVVKWMEQLEYI